MSVPHLHSFTGDATLWFAQVEAHFAAHGVSPIQQLHLLYCSLPPQLATSARDLIIDPSPDATYASIKAEILRRNTRSEESRFNELMADERLGDKTPSQFLRCLRELSGNFADAPLLRKIFFSMLPANLQAILATALESNSVDQIATMADKTLEFSGQPKSRGMCVCTETPSTASVSASSLSPDTISDKIDALTRRTDELCRENRRRWRSRSRSTSRASFHAFRMQAGGARSEHSNFFTVNVPAASDTRSGLC
ncbi:uncharacterized protein LOC115210491 [Octopus sinensis]|uniref:Uncharacterized protein LOC115210491 n=1 Tax=Octopus sinensis TaxID=2607531 RepID=A0A6P7S9F5_9MOLL|nr:uncharacterized protein LOC115210491 [Octopus sinensis]